MKYTGLGFVIDNVGEQPADENVNDPIINNVFQEFLQEKLKSTTNKVPTNSKKLPSAFETFSDNMNFTRALMQCGKTKSKKYEKPKLDVTKMSKSSVEVQNVLSKSIVLQPEFEQLKSVPSQIVSDKKLKLQRKLEREKTKGKKWFDMPATELTNEVKKDLEVIQMRSILDPKHFYKKNDLKVLPKFFQIGKVMDSPLDFYNSRLTKKERKKTLVDELLADAEFNKYNKKKYAELLKEKQKTHYKAYREARRLKKKKK